MSETSNKEQKICRRERGEKKKRERKNNEERVENLSFNICKEPRNTQRTHNSSRWKSHGNGKKGHRGRGGRDEWRDLGFPSSNPRAHDQYCEGDDSAAMWEGWLTQCCRHHAYINVGGAYIIANLFQLHHCPRVG